MFDDDPFSKIKEGKSGPPVPTGQVVNKFHTRSDKDSSNFAQHHTLGTDHNQAAPGDHAHDGKNSRKVGFGRGLVISGAKNTAASEDSIVAMLKQVIEFTDGRV